MTTRVHALSDAEAPPPNPPRVHARSASLALVSSDECFAPAPLVLVVEDGWVDGVGGHLQPALGARVRESLDHAHSALASLAVSHASLLPMYGVVGGGDAGPMSCVLPLTAVPLTGTVAA